MANKIKKALSSDGGVIDLASIMTGIIVIGLIGSVIAATVFAVIPWAQDSAAKNQLNNINSAQSAFLGQSADGLAVSGSPVSFGTLTSEGEGSLADARLMPASPDGSYCTLAVGSGEIATFEAYAQSLSGKVFGITANNTQPQQVEESEPVCLSQASDSTPVSPDSPELYDVRLGVYLSIQDNSAPYGNESNIVDISLLCDETGCIADGDWNKYCTTPYVANAFSCTGGWQPDAMSYGDSVIASDTISGWIAPVVAACNTEAVENGYTQTDSSYSTCLQNKFHETADAPYEYKNLAQTTQNGYPLRALVKYSTGFALVK